MPKVKPILITLSILLMIGILFKSPISNLLSNGIFKTLPPEHLTSPLPAKYANLIKQKENVYLFKNVNIIPMIADTIIFNQDILIRNGKIEQIAKTKSTNNIPPNCIEIDGSDKFLIPGLSDMHTHINDDNNLLMMVCNGILTTRNMAGFPFHLELKKKIALGNILGPRLYTTSPILEGPHQIWKNSVGSIKITSLESIGGMIQQIKNQGYDFIKVYHTLSPEYYFEILDHLDQDKNLLAVGHMPIDVGIYDFLDRSQYSIEHIEIDQLRKISPELSLETKAELLGKSGKWICPTLIVHKRQNKQLIENNLAKRYEKMIDPKTKKFWKARLKNKDNEYELRKKLVQIIHAQNGQFLTGSDCLNSYVLPGFSLHEELVELVNCGLTAFEVLNASTVNAANFLKNKEHSGTIEIGKNANLVLLHQNPLENIKFTREIDGVMIKGKWLNSKEIRQILDDIKASYLN